VQLSACERLLILGAVTHGFASAFNGWLFNSKSNDSKWKSARGAVMCIWEEEIQVAVGDWGRFTI
jgi:hypothetical protein